MMTTKLKLIINIWRILPYYIYIYKSKKCNILIEDTIRWKEIYNMASTSDLVFFAYALLNLKEYRNLMYYRMNKGSRIIRSSFKFFFPIYDSLFIYTNDIGSGLFIQHGFSTIITAKHIGKNCFINQQVTIGADKPNEDLPWIGDNVRICAGAIIIGGIHIGNNSCIGAGAVVINDVKEGATVVGVPAKPISRN